MYIYNILKYMSLISIYVDLREGMLRSSVDFYPLNNYIQGLLFYKFQEFKLWLSSQSKIKEIKNSCKEEILIINDE